MSQNNVGPEIDGSAPNIQKIDDQNRNADQQPSFSRVKKLPEKAVLPSRVSSSTASYDLSSAIETKVKAPKETIPESSRPVKSSKRKNTKSTTNPVPVQPDIATGNAQTDGTFWNRVTGRFHSRMGREAYRTTDEIKSKWVELNLKVGKFHEIYTNLLNQGRNGCTEADILREALERYKSEHNGSEFTHVEVWELLRKSPKWVTMWQMDRLNLGV